MRVIVFFDLPVTSVADRRAYAQFRRQLVRHGFVMMQESVYSKLALNMGAASATMDLVRRHKPPAGLVQMMIVTEKQYARMEYVVGERQTEILESDERTVFL